MTSFLQGHLSGSFRPGRILNTVPDTSSGSFPTVVDTATSATTGSGATTHSVTLPSYSAGDTVIVIAASTGNSVDISSGDHWVQYSQSAYTDGVFAVFVNEEIGYIDPLVLTGENPIIPYKYACASICVRGSTTRSISSVSKNSPTAVTSTESPGIVIDSPAYAILISVLGINVPATITAPEEWQALVTQKQHPGVSGPSVALTWMADRTGSANPGAWTHSSSVSASAMISCV